jgi:hypothetical protein
MLNGKPYEELGKIYFRSPDLYSYLERRKFREYSPSQVFTNLRKLGAGHKTFNLKGACVQTWCMPIPKSEQTEPFDPIVNDEPTY